MEEKDTSVDGSNTKHDSNNKGLYNIRSMIHLKKYEVYAYYNNYDTFLIIF